MEENLIILLDQVYPYKVLHGCKQLLHLSWVTDQQKVGNVNKSACRLGSYDPFLHVGDMQQIHETHMSETEIGKWCRETEVFIVIR